MAMHLDARPERLVLEPSRTALIVVDMQNAVVEDFVGCVTTSGARARGRAFRHCHPRGQMRRSRA